MNPNTILQFLVAAALVFTLVAFGWRLRIFARLSRPADRSLPRGSRSRGVLYAYTLGMAPWAKESTRIHMLAYLRGVAFHLGIFLGLGLLVASPWVHLLPGIGRYLLAAGAGLGTIFGLAGFVMRFVEHNLKSLSTPDDYFTVLVVSLFQAAATLWLLVPSTIPVFYGVSAILLVYAPFSKIRHCIYFVYSRLFFGKFFGGRAILPHDQQMAR